MDSVILWIYEAKKNYQFFPFPLHSLSSWKKTHFTYKHRRTASEVKNRELIKILRSPDDPSNATGAREKDERRENTRLVNVQMRFRPWFCSFHAFFCMYVADWSSSNRTNSVGLYDEISFDNVFTLSKAEEFTAEYYRYFVFGPSSRISIYSNDFWCVLHLVANWFRKNGKTENHVY